jgi:hypothetical protein
MLALPTIMTLMLGIPLKPPVVASIGLFIYPPGVDQLYHRLEEPQPSDEA